LIDLRMDAIGVRDLCVVHRFVGCIEGTQLRHLKEGDPLPYFTPAGKKKHSHFFGDCP
jgi:hypothetical protein